VGLLAHTSLWVPNQNCSPKLDCILLLLLLLLLPLQGM
jgi:hypothetical protein